MHILKNTRIYKVLLAILYVFVFLINDPQIIRAHNLEMNYRETISENDLAGRSGSVYGRRSIRLSSGLRIERWYEQ